MSALLKSPNLVFVSAGDHHLLHPSLRGDRAFDLFIYFYGSDKEVRNGLSQVADRIEERQGGKFPNLHHLWQHEPDLLKAYEAILVLDDDLALTARQIDRLFEIRHAHDLWVLQPSFTRRGRWSFRTTLTHLRTSLRYTNFIELGAPLFRRDKLEQFLNVYDGSLVGYGVDFWYMNVLGENVPQRYAVADEVVALNPHKRKATGTREIDRLQSLAERRGNWLRRRDVDGLHDIAVQATGGIRRPFPIMAGVRWLGDAAVWIPRRLALRAYAKIRGAQQIVAPAPQPSTPWQASRSASTAPRDS